MKKAKLMLAAVAVFAVVGGSLAFKAKKFNGNQVFYALTAGHKATSILPDYTLGVAAFTPTLTGFYTVIETTIPVNSAKVTVTSDGDGL